MFRPYIVMMAGGRGERFWPLSTEARPKPFLNLFGKGSMLQQAIKRIEGAFPKESIFIVLAEEHLPIARSQLPHIPIDNFIVEPFGRDTAACIGLASIHLELMEKDAIMVVLAADHWIPDVEEFIRTLRAGIEYLKKENVIITLGMEPTRPEIGYGYIETGDEVSTSDGYSILKVLRFVEKPDRRRAEEYLSSGRFYWNSGMFIWRNTLLQELLSCFMPSHWKALIKIKDAILRGKEREVLEREFKGLEKISIDVGVLEKAGCIFLIPSRFRWDDVGGWTALSRVTQPDIKGNLIRGDALAIDTQGCIIHSEDELVATMGVRDLVIVHANGKILVASRECAPELKRLVRRVKDEIEGAHRKEQKL